MSDSMQENKMGVMPEGKLLLTMSVPMILSMLVQALYNIVDSIFVAKLNEAAFTAVSLAFPVQNVMISLGVGTSVGVSALCSRYLGAKRQRKANSVANHGIMLAFITGICFAIIVFIFTRSFYTLFADDQVIYNYSLDYTYIVGGLCMGVMFQMMLERILQSTGRMILSMAVQMTGAIINIILDPILIFGMFGLPRLEVKGAAIATVTGQVIAAILAFFFVLKKNPEIQVSLKGFRPRGKVIASIYQIAVPSIILSSVGSIMVSGFNKILVGFSSTAAAVFGGYFKLQSFIFMPIFGMNNGMIPIIAYNYGAAKPKRIYGVLKRAYIAAISIMAVGTILFQLAPDKLLMLFSASDEMLAMGIPALKIISIHFIVAGYCIATGALFQAVGYAHYSMINSIMRQLLVLLPAAYILAKIGGLDMLWWSFPIAEISSALVSTFFLIKVNKQVIKPLYE